MISTKAFVASILALIFSPLTAASACPKGEPNSTDYIRRENNRCEGIKADPVSGNSLSFISISTHKLNSYGDKLTIDVPQIAGGGQPQVIVKSLGDDYHYQLDDFQLSKSTTRFRFNWSSYVLQTKKIPSGSLRGLASYSSSSQSIYVPVIFGGSSNNYEFTFYSQSRVKFTIFKIISPDGKIVYSTNQVNYQDGETTFVWDGSNVPAGRYTIDYIANIERKDQPSDRIPGRIVFAHDPNWLK
jgi:hypothetical protein